MCGLQGQATTAARQRCSTQRLVGAWKLTVWRYCCARVEQPGERSGGEELLLGIVVMEAARCYCLRPLLLCCLAAGTAV